MNFLEINCKRGFAENQGLSVCQVASDVPKATDGDGMLLISESLASIKEKGKDLSPNEFYGFVTSFCLGKGAAKAGSVSN